METQIFWTTGYGQETRGRRQRQQIPYTKHTIDGVVHHKVQFQARGPNGRATVHADMIEKGRDMEFTYLIVDVLKRFELC